MIVPMKKIAVITQAKDADGAVKSLRKLGVLHVEHAQPPKGRDISQIQDDLTLLNQAIEVISKVEFATGCEGSLVRRDTADWKSACRRIIDVWKRLDQLEEFSRSLILKIEEWTPWGDFDPGSIHQLAAKNVFVRLYQVPTRGLDKFPETATVKEIFTKSNIAYCAVISREKFECPFKEVEIPKMGISSMHKRLAEDRRIIEALGDELKTLFCYQPELIEIKKSLEKEFEFQEALSGMAQAGNLTYIVGYAPFDSEKALREVAGGEKWGICIDDPAQDDPVPTFIRNPKWVSVISPVFRMIEVVPGYHELDISPLFLLFLSLFFGMIIGDAGYGLIYFGLTFLAQRAWGKKMDDKSVFFLFYLFSFCAIIWGLLTGTVFGQEWYLGRGFKAFVPILNNTKFLQALCFFIGAFHLTLAHSWRAVLKLPSPSALADIGWICVLWAAFFLAKLLILGESFPFFGKWLIIAGVTLVILFTNPQKNILKGIGEGLATVALSLVNNFTDVVSYIRLFAVGLAGVAISNTVNTLAGSAGDGNILAQSLIIFAGHTINMLLGPMSVLVHGIRLNVLEFSSHANVTWSGVAYRPLKE
jgi:V/A-type H+-transporting ATPase subunit I